MKSCDITDGRAGVYYVTYVHGHSVDKIDHFATCLLQIRRKIVSLSDFARDEGPDPLSDWNFSGKIAAMESTDVERYEVLRMEETCRR